MSTGCGNDGTKSFVECADCYTRHVAEVVIPANELDRWNRLLAADGCDYESEGLPVLGLAARYTVRFPDGCSVDIKVCTGNRDEPLFSEAVLFGADGSQIAFVDSQDERLDGEWSLERSGGVSYSVNVKTEKTGSRGNAIGPICSRHGLLEYMMESLPPAAEGVTFDYDDMDEGVAYVTTGAYEFKVSVERIGDEDT